MPVRKHAPIDTSWHAVLRKKTSKPLLNAQIIIILKVKNNDITRLFKRMKFAGGKIFTLSEGEISSLHIGLKGTMNAMFLKDLADKTRRGLRGRIEQGKSGGGLAYGYKVVKSLILKAKLFVVIVKLSKSKLSLSSAYSKNMDIKTNLPKQLRIL